MRGLKGWSKWEGERREGAWGGTQWGYIGVVGEQWERESEVWMGVGGWTRDGTGGWMGWDGMGWDGSALHWLAWVGLGWDGVGHGRY